MRRWFFCFLGVLLGFILIASIFNKVKAACFSGSYCEYEQSCESLGLCPGSGTCLKGVCCKNYGPYCSSYLSCPAGCTPNCGGGYCNPTPIPTKTPTPTPSPTRVICQSGYCDSIACGAKGGVCVRAAGIYQQQFVPNADKGCFPPGCQSPNNAAVYDKCVKFPNINIPGDDCSSTGWYCGISQQCSSENYTGCQIGTVGSGRCDVFPVPTNLPFCGTGKCGSFGVCYQRSVICCNINTGTWTYNTTLCPNNYPYYCGDNCVYNRFCSDNCESGGGGGGEEGGTGPTNTPIPTPGPGPWTKLKNASFASNKTLVNPIPSSPVSYDSEDTTDPYFIIGQGGLVSAPAINIKNLNPNAKANPSDWISQYATNYEKISQPENFLKYVISRKTNKKITNLNQINNDGIYIYDSENSLDIDFLPLVFNQYNIVLITNQTVNINTDLLPTKSIAIIAQTINFNQNIKEAKGIFIAKSISTGQTTNQGLKIIGNLAALETLTNSRQWTDKNKPVLFIVFDQKQYLDLLPYISVISYDWRKVE